METEANRQYDIRQATVADVADLIRMQTALQESTDGIRRNLLRLNTASEARLYEYYLARLQDKQTRLLIAQATRPARAVGMGTGRVWLHADYLPPRSGEVVDIWIDPEHRRRNLATRIIRNLVQFFKANHIELLVVNYLEGNSPGERLWRRLGFEPVLVTATVDRVKAETSLGIRSAHSPPFAYRSVLSHRKDLYTHSALSG
jgi:ribosomal protein S18 acetylase RimI-like enzyme